MALETGTYISDLVATNPTGSDPLAFADDHLRLVKSTLKSTFPNISGAVTKTHAEINALPSFDQIYPVGSIYINAANATNPGTLLGLGTWVSFGAGRVPVGFNAADPLFDAAEETGGSKDAIVVAHTHTGSTGFVSNDHSHGFSGTTDVQGTHQHATTAGQFQTFGSQAVGGTGFYDGGFSQPGALTSSAGAHAHNYSGNTGGISANHNHAFTTASSGSSATNANLQPYITVYMWKRTA